MMNSEQTDFKNKIKSEGEEKMKENEDLIQKTPYPKAVLFIISNELCERFSYFGMRAILVLYFMDHLLWTSDKATGVYHAFIVGCYLTPIIGAVLADGYIGKFRTILYLSAVYTLGSTLMSFTAFPPPFWLGPCIGLTLIAFGTGGIKPCVSAFGGDQFKESQHKERSMFFSMFYFAINLGSFSSMVLTPLIKDGVSCFGKKCYSLAFGIPALLMVIAVFLFVWGRKWYTINPPTGSVITNVVKCIGSAIKNRVKSGMSGEGSSRKEHWLDYAGPQYQTSFLADVKQILKIFLLFIPVPVFWALFDQMGSRWTLQSVQLDRRMSDNWYLLPEQIQAINSVLILVFIPLFELGIYPCMDKLKIPNKPLQRLVVGMLFASLAFVASGLLQITIDNTQLVVDANNSRVSFINQVPCGIKVTGSLPQIDLLPNSMSSQLSVPANKYTFLADRTPILTSPIPKIPNYTNYDDYSAGNKEFCLNVDFGHTSLTLDLKHEYTYYVVYSISPVGVNDTLGGSNPDGDVMTVVASHFSYDYIREPTGECYIRITLIGVETEKLLSAKLIREGSEKTSYMETFNYSNSRYIAVSPGKYKIILQENGRDEYSLDTFIIINGGKYTVLINRQPNKVTSTLLEDLPPNVVSIWLQFPQYILITLAEVVFAVTGLSFAYSQAPTSMKSVVQAAWLLTTAFGNVIDVIITGSNLIPKQYIEFFFFAVLMFITTIIFAIMSTFYKYVDHKLPPPYEILTPSDPGNDNTNSKNLGRGGGDDLKDDNDKRMMAIKDHLYNESGNYDGTGGVAEGVTKRQVDPDKGYIAEMSLNR